jgi:hypothetical protein
MRWVRLMRAEDLSEELARPLVLRLREEAIGRRLLDDRAVGLEHDAVRDAAREGVPPEECKDLRIYWLATLQGIPRNVMPPVDGS